MNRLASPQAIGLAVAFLATAQLGAVEPFRVYGSSTVAQAFKPATKAILDDTGADLAFETSVGSNVAIQTVASGQVDIAMSTREVTQQDRSLNPSFSLFDSTIGLQVLVPVVTKATWDAGVRKLKKDDFIKLYEGDLRSWKAIGGPDLKPVFVNPSDGRGVWEPFVTWLYGDLHKVGPGRRWPIVASNEEAHERVLNTPGALTILPPKWVDGKALVALPIVDEQGAEIAPTEANFRSKKWPLVRPIVIVAGNKPAGLLRKVFDFMVGPKGQAYVEAAEFLPRPEAAEEMAARFK